MPKLTVMIPSRNEIFLNRTVQDLFEKARGDIEIIVALDGYWPDELPPHDKRLKFIHWGAVQGMRRGQDAVAAIATGDYLMKCDAHCMFAEGFDLVLIEASQPNWVQIPRRYSLDAEKWEKYKYARDYLYLTYPVNPKAGDWGGAGFHGYEWRERDRDKERQKLDLDDTMSFQGSCWFMPRDYFFHLGLMDSENYDPFWQEAQDIGIKVWLDGGRIIRNKRTWYAHLHKGKQYGRGYFIQKNSLQKPVEYTKELVRKNRKKLESIFESYMPIPGWPDDWKEHIFD